MLCLKWFGTGTDLSNQHQITAERPGRSEQVSQHLSTVAPLCRCAAPLCRCTSQLQHLSVAAPLSFTAQHLSSAPYTGSSSALRSTSHVVADRFDEVLAQFQRLDCSIQEEVNKQAMQRQVFSLASRVEGASVDLTTVGRTLIDQMQVECGIA